LIYPAQGRGEDAKDYQSKSTDKKIKGISLIYKETK
jgi:hypothetical protein